MTSADQVAKISSTTRDPFLDVIRAFAMIAVIANHYLYTLLFRNQQGQFELVMLQENGNPWVSWPFIWELQAFFLPAAALSYSAALRTNWRVFIGRRVWRLLVPVVPLLIGLILLQVTTSAAGMGKCASWTTGLTCATAMPISPLWFLMVLVPLTIATPLLARAWRGPWRIVMPLVVFGFSLISDARWISTGSTIPLNDISVWLLVWFAGFAYADGTLLRVRAVVWWRIVVGGSLLMVGMVVVGPYPPWIGSSPRTSMAALECVVGVSLLMALRSPLSRIRDRKFVDLCVRQVGDRVMGVFLWNYFSFAVVISAMGLLGVDLASKLGGAYLVQRAVIIPLSLLLMVAALRATKWADRVPYPPDRRQIAAKEIS